MVKRNLFGVQMKFLRQVKKGILIEGLLILALLIIFSITKKETVGESQSITVNGKYIKWVEFNVSYEALNKAYELDVANHNTEHPLNWIELLAYAGAKTGGEFNKKALTYISQIAEKIIAKETTIEKATKDMEYYPYYLEAYNAVLGGFVGEYKVQQCNDSSETEWVTKYGLKAFSPIAKNFPYEDYDDFGASRSYGYARPHLGHDMLGQVGTPIICIESGTVEAIGWNQYGGWRLGIRSEDKKRYYYYAHLRQNYPYAEWIEEGSQVKAGDVIGYMGHTGYSTKENVNNIEITHLHWGMQLIFDESQKESDNEIWIDVYDLSRFLYKNRSEVCKVDGTKEWKRVYDFEEQK